MTRCLVGGRTGEIIAEVIRENPGTAKQIAAMVNSKLENGGYAKCNLTVRHINSYLKDHPDGRALVAEGMIEL